MKLTVPRRDTTRRDADSLHMVERLGHSGSTIVSKAILQANDTAVLARAGMVS